MNGFRKEILIMKLQRSYSGTIENELNLSKSFIDCALFLRQVLLVVIIITINSTMSLKYIRLFLEFSCI